MLLSKWDWFQKILRLLLTLPNFEYLRHALPVSSSIDASGNICVTLDASLKGLIKFYNLPWGSVQDLILGFFILISLVLIGFLFYKIHSLHSTQKNTFSTFSTDLNQLRVHIKPSPKPIVHPKPERVIRSMSGNCYHDSILKDKNISVPTPKRVQFHRSITTAQSVPIDVAPDDIHSIPLLHTSRPVLVQCSRPHYPTHSPARGSSPESEFELDHFYQ